MDLLSLIGGVWNMFMQFLSGFLDITYFLPVVLCLVVAAIFNPRGPTSANQLVVSFIFGSIGAFLLVLLLRGTLTDAIVLALIILTVGLIWLFIRSEGWISKLVVGVLSILSIGAVITYSGASPGAGVLPQAVNTIVASAQQIFNTFTQQL